MRGSKRKGFVRKASVRSRASALALCPLKDGTDPLMLGKLCPSIGASLSYADRAMVARVRSGQ
jgi:hypothetical protein